MLNQQIDHLSGDLAVCFRLLQIVQSEQVLPAQEADEHERGDHDDSAGQQREAEQAGDRGASVHARRERPVDTEREAAVDRRHHEETELTVPVLVRGVESRIIHSVEDVMK